MALYLSEILTGSDERGAAEELVERLGLVASGAGGRLLEVQVSGDFDRIFFVAEDVDAVQLTARIADLGVARTEPAPVRLVGATVDQVRARAAGAASHLVEWDFPAGLDMDTYLARMKEMSPLYVQVPEVSFFRTYVREDMGKCLCLYDAPDDAAVVRAREVVTTPIDRLHRLAETSDVAVPSLPEVSRHRDSLLGAAPCDRPAGMPALAVPPVALAVTCARLWAGSCRPRTAGPPRNGSSR